MYRVKKHIMPLLLVLMMFASSPAIAESLTVYAETARPVIKEVRVYPSSGKAKAKITFSTKKGKKYQILYKTGSQKYKVLKTYKAKSSQTAYTATGLEKDLSYTVTVREVTQKNNKTTYGTKAKEISFKTTFAGAPIINEMRTYPSGNEVKSKVTFQSVPGVEYEILRKTADGPFAVRDVIVAKKDQTAWSESISAKAQYAYTVREIQKSGKVRSVGYWNTQQCDTLHSVADLQVDFTNLQATVSWSGDNTISEYWVYRKTSDSASYKKIAVIPQEQGKKAYTYTDVYHDSFQTTAEKNLLMASYYYLDPSSNPLHYTVRAVQYGDNGFVNLAFYEQDGFFRLENPTIIRYEENGGKGTICFGTVQNADGYYIYQGVEQPDGYKKWTKVATVAAKTSAQQSCTFLLKNDGTFFTVVAYADDDGKTIRSGYDDQFTTKNREYADTSILFLGDSITYGSPYKGKTTKDVFSYPYRVSQLTSVSFYNPSIPGSTWHYDEAAGRDRIVKQVAEVINNGGTPYALYNSIDPYHANDPVQYFAENTKTFEDFDVIILAAGTNDYLDDTPFGALDSDDIATYNGALNEILGYIEQASQARIAAGKEATKVVFVDLFYSDRTYVYSELTNRFVTKNRIGLTLQDYQDNQDALIEQYRNNADISFSIYQFHTNNYDLINQENCPYRSSDNLHMTRFTYSIIGNTLTKFLINEGVL